jgi:WD40 repeat protein
MTSDVVFDCAFNPSGDRLAAAAADGVVRVFHIEGSSAEGHSVEIGNSDSGNDERTITSHSDWVFAVAWNADGSQFATGSRDKTAKVFDAKTGELLITYNGHNQPVRGVAFHPDGKRVYSAGSDGRLHLWNIADGKKAGDMPGTGGEAYKLTATGDWLFTSSIDRNVRQFDAKEDKIVRELKGASDWVLSTSLDTAHKRLAGGTFDGQVFLWNVEDGKLLTSFYAAPGYKAAKK